MVFSVSFDLNDPRYHAGQMNKTLSINIGVNH